MRRLLETLLLVLLVAVFTIAAPRAHALCVAGSGRGELPVVFVGIAIGKDLHRPREPHWPHQFRVEEIERGLEDFEPGDVLAVDLAVNERFEGGLERWVEDNLGDAPLVGARYRVGAYTSDAPEGSRFHANGCGGFLTRLPDPEDAEPYRQVLSTERTGADSEQPTVETVDGKGRALPGPRGVAAGLAGLTIGAVLLIRRTRNRASSPDSTARASSRVGPSGGSAEG